MNSDRELLRAYATTCDEAAFAGLVERHLGMVHAAALRQVGGDAHLAHDVAQGVFIDLARKAPGLPASTVLAAWLYTSTRFAAANAVRAERRRRTREQEASLMNDDDAAAGDAAWQQVRPVLDDVLATLEPADREAVILRFFRNKSFGEIGGELLLKEDTARTRVVRALQKLSDGLRHRGVTSTAEALGAVLAVHAVGAAPAGSIRQITQAALQAAHPAALAGSAKTVAFMSTTKILGTVAVCGALLLLLVDVRSLRRENDALRHTALALERPAAVPAPPVVAPAIPPPAPPRPAPPPGALRSYSDVNLIADPDYGATIARRERRYALANDRDAVDAMGLPPADALRLKELLAAHWIAGTDASDVLDRMGNATAEFREKARAAAQAEAEQKTRDLLGAEGYARFRTIAKEQSERRMNWALFTDFWDAGVPLSAEQQIQMARALVAAPAGPAGDVQLLEAAAGFLTPEQAGFLRERKLADARYREATR